MNTIPPPPLSDEMRDYYRALSAKGKPIMWQKKADGECMHKAPFGYLNYKDELGRSVIRPDPRTFSILKYIARRRAQGASIRTLCNEMDGKKITSKSGKKIGPSSIINILRQIDRNDLN